MYYRRKILLSLLQAFGGELETIKLQKLLFLFTKTQESPAYNFVPYKFGCVSFLSYADKRTLEKYKIIKKKDNTWAVNKKHNYLNDLKENDRINIIKLEKKYKKWDLKKIIKHVYLNYPYFASKSEIIHNYLNKNEIAGINRRTRFPKKNILMTIGYEGRDIDSYMNILIKNDIKILCDVRKNALSMKYGYSKNQLKNIASKLNIEYIHTPELGIDSNKRQNLETKDDYMKLFSDYKKTTLKRSRMVLEKLSQTFLNAKRAALTCFEKDPEYCHRSIITKEITRIHPGWGQNLINA